MHKQTNRRFKTISEVDRHYRRVLIRIAHETQCRMAYDIAMDELGLEHAGELQALARKEKIDR